MAHEMHIYILKMEATILDEPRDEAIIMNHVMETRLGSQYKAVADLI